MSNQTTMLSNLINPQVMADMISAKVEKKIVVAPFAKVDTILEGMPGDTITVPQYAYIGDAVDIAEGVAAETVKLTTTTTTAKIKKAMKAVEIGLLFQSISDIFLLLRIPHISCGKFLSYDKKLYCYIYTTWYNSHRI